MDRRVTIAGLAVVASIALTIRLGSDSSTALAQQTQPPRGPTQQPKGPARPTTQPTEGRPGAAPPGTHGVPGTPRGLRPEEIEKQIPPQEREAMGLPQPTWIKEHGKVHPLVREVLKTGQMPWLRYKGYWSEAFIGTAYVAVYLRCEKSDKPSSKADFPAIQEAQSRVLSRLTALEFSTVYAFTSTPGLLGYVSAEGLAKLEKDTDVLAVVLDDTPLPKDPPPVAHDEAWGNRPERIGKITVEVYKALDKSPDGYIYVHASVTEVPRGEGPFHETYEKKLAEERKLDSALLNTLTAQEFRLRQRGGVLSGYANASGLAKLDKHSDVTSVFLTAYLHYN